MGYYLCEFPRTGGLIGARNITQCQRYLTTTPILPHLRCGGIDAAPHPHGLPENGVANEAQGDGLSGDASSSL